MSLASESLTLRVQAEQIAHAYDTKPPSPGAPSTIGNPELVQQLLAAIRDGNYRETACRAAGISKQTFYNWLKRAEHGDEAAIRFVDALEKAEAEAERETVSNVRSASKLPQFWAAGMTYLERKYPDRWGRRQDDQTAPRVVVQIGAAVNDVQVNVLTQSLSPAVSSPFHSLSPSDEREQSLITMDSVNHEPEGGAARDPVEGPVGERAGLGLRNGIVGKGRSGRVGRKKGQA